MTLVEFLTARLEEDEAAARERWNASGVTSEKFHGTPYDPPRVLREVEAKRAILNLHLPHSPWCRWSQDADEPHGEDLCDTLRLLASVYSDHPDYDESWRP